MSQVLSIIPESAIQPECAGKKPRMAFIKLMKLLALAEQCATTVTYIEELLNTVGLSNKGGRRIMRLSREEIHTLSKNIPEDDELWPHYLSEIQMLLSKMDQARKIDPFIDRPRVTSDLARAVNSLTYLRYFHEQGQCSLQTSKLCDLLKRNGWCKSISGLIETGERDNLHSESMPIESIIRFMTLYRDELIAPPRLKSRWNFDQFDLQMIESEDFSWMDDGGKSYLEAIRDIPLASLVDELPNFDSVLYWFISTKPVLDHNQVKSGWPFLEKSNEKWLQSDEAWANYEMRITLSAYPNWNCAVADRQDAWLATLPSDHPYTLVPLTTPQQLYEESKEMHHCVVRMIDYCICGQIRIFSIKNSHNNQRIATTELSVISGLWQLVQLKGKHNLELIQLADIPDEPLAIILEALVNCYNSTTTFIPGCDYSSSPSLPCGDQSDFMIGKLLVSQ